MDALALILVDPDPDLCAAWRREFQGARGVEVVHGRFEQLPRFDCLVAPANAFGLMDGGADAAIADFFGPALPARVRARIRDEYLGEQPVGTSLLVETFHPAHRYVAHTPTMRFPAALAGTDNVYTAMWAALLAVRAHNRRAPDPIGALACPGLGTGTGMMPPEEAARQMRLAYRHFLNPPADLDWQRAAARDADIRGNG